MSRFSHDGKIYNCRKVKNSVFPFFLHICFDKRVWGDAYCGHEGNFYVVLHPDVPVSIIAHEACHITQYIGVWIEEELKGECEAYMIQWIVDEIMKVKDRK
jgi:hypothetical protein